MKSKRIGLFGGTFNPIHKGHLHVAGAVTERLDLDCVLFIPSGLPPHKETKDLPSARHRMAMVRLALFETPKFKACDLEIKQVSPSYTVDTVAALKRDHPNDRLIFIIGTDAFSQLHTWKTPERLLELCSFAIISRPEHPFSRSPKITRLKDIDHAALEDLDHGKRADYPFAIGPQTVLHFISIPHSPISATEIRRRIAKGQGERKRLPQLVGSYIIEHRLY